MKICEKHWAAMRAASEERGMTQLSSLERVKAYVADQQAGNKDSKSYDPLFDMNNMVMTAALELGGPSLMVSDGCPICMVFDHYVGEKDEDGTVLTLEYLTNFWINGPADAAMCECRRLGLLQVN